MCFVRVIREDVFVRTLRYRDSEHIASSLKLWSVSFAPSFQSQLFLCTLFRIRFQNPSAHIRIGLKCISDSTDDVSSMKSDSIPFFRWYVSSWSIFKKNTILSWHNHEEAIFVLNLLQNYRLWTWIKVCSRVSEEIFRFLRLRIHFISSTYALSQIDNLSLGNFFISQEFLWVHTWDYEKNESRSSIEIYTH